jgi:chorismate mutase/prephenate dehydratase
VTLDDVRKDIDTIDNQLLVLLNQRMKLVHKVGEIKRSTKAIIYRPEREKQILDRMNAQNDGPLNKEAIEAIYEYNDWPLTAENRKNFRKLFRARTSTGA